MFMERDLLKRPIKKMKTDLLKRPIYVQRDLYMCKETYKRDLYVYGKRLTQETNKKNEDRLIKETYIYIYMQRDLCKRPIWVGTAERFAEICTEGRTRPVYIKRGLLKRPVYIYAKRPV